MPVRHVVPTRMRSGDADPLQEPGAQRTKYGALGNRAMQRIGRTQRC